MLESFTEGSLRALRRAHARAHERGAQAIEPVDLLAALADEPESRAALLLAEHGLDADSLFEAIGTRRLDPTLDSDPAHLLPQSASLRAVLADAALQARELARSRAVSTEHLLLSLLEAPGPAAELLARAGLELATLFDRMAQSTHAESSPIPMASEIPPLELTSPAEAADLGRILDASANRAREGLRVIEDYARFVLDDPILTRRFKNVRHRLAEAVRGLDADLLLGSRDTQADVGTHIMEADEPVRENARAVLTANFKRVTEALRSLEEYSKLVDIWISGRFETLRYDFYTLEKVMLAAVAAHRALGAARLYLLAGGLPTLGDLTWRVGEALAGGAEVIQLREKGLPDRVLLEYAQEVRRLTEAAHARFILNDRPDLARIVGADGVHLGQDDLTVGDARRVVGPRSLIGISTHDTCQLEQAALSGASYLGVGPVFVSDTKEFRELSGLSFVREAAAATTLPWFAIGGITSENLDEVLEAGARRVAVRSAILAADRPRDAAAELRARLDEWPLV